MKFDDFLLLKCSKEELIRIFFLSYLHKRKTCRFDQGIKNILPYEVMLICRKQHRTIKTIKKLQKINNLLLIVTLSLNYCNKPDPSLKDDCSQFRIGFSSYDMSVSTFYIQYHTLKRTECVCGGGGGVACSGEGTNRLQIG